MNRMSLRLDKLERAGANAWRAWERVPAGFWPEQALIAFLAERQGWPPGYEPRDAELRAVVARSGNRGATA